MSYLTGDGSDLYTHIMFEKMYDKGNCKVSDLMECFEIFKEKTNGTLYQYHKLILDKSNLQFAEAHCENFSYKIENKKYIFTYYNKEYIGFKEINKKGVYAKTKIYFNTILELLPFLNYGICFAGCDDKYEQIVITNQSIPDYEFADRISHGALTMMYDHYRNNLSDLYYFVCKNYLLYKLEERTKIIDLVDLVKEDKNYILTTKTKIDYNHKIEYIWDDGQTHTHYSSPVIVADNKIRLNEFDIEFMLKEDIKNNKVKIKYVEYPENGFPLYLN